MSLKRIQAQQAENLRLRQQLDTARKFLTDLPNIRISEQPEWNYSENNGEIWWYFLSRYCKEALAAISEAQPETLPTISFNRNGATMAEFPSSKCQVPKPASAEVKSVLDELTDEQRQDLFSHYCTSCGGKELPCYCVRDD